MPTNFQFPLSYIESMLPNAATATETVTAPMPPDEQVLNSAAALKELLNSLESPTIPQPQQPRQYQRVLGALGDALGSMASVRAGGAPVPVGPFAANLQARQRAYEQQKMEADQEAMKQRNDARLLFTREELQRQREKEVAGMRAGQIKGAPGYLTDEEGNRRLVNIRRDGQGRVIGIEDVGESNFAPFIQPAIPGESPPTRIPRAGPPGPIGKTPPPPEAVGEKAARLGGFARDIENFKKSLPGFIKSRGATGRIGQQILRKTPVIGPQISERVSKEGELIAAARDSAMADFTRIMSGLQASEAEQARLARILPDLGTVDAETAIAKIDQFEQSVRAYAHEIVSQRPNLLTPELKELLGLESGGTSDPARDLFRQMFGRDPEE